MWVIKFLLQYETWPHCPAGELFAAFFTLYSPIFFFALNLYHNKAREKHNRYLKFTIGFSLTLIALLLLSFAFRLDLPFHRKSYPGFSIFTPSDNSVFAMSIACVTSIITSALASKLGEVLFLKKGKRFLAGCIFAVIWLTALYVQTNN